MARMLPSRERGVKPARTGVNGETPLG